jgi:recombination protein RecA
MVRKKSTKSTTLFDNNAENQAEVNEAKLKQMEATLADITKRFGDGTVVRLGDAKHMQVETIPSGSLGVDIAIGVGGIPRGRITEIYGPESSGKTTLCLHVIAEAQKRGGLAAFIDMENALDPTYAERIGVNLDTLFVSQPDTGEQALEICETLVRSGALDVVVVDSVAALVPRAEIEGEMGDSHVGLQARLMSQALRKLAGAVKQSNVVLMFTNQLREKVGVMFGCFHYDARVVLADGTSEKIGKLVNQKREVEVLSYNTQTRMFEPRRIVNWFNNGKTDHFLQFVVDSNQGRGRREFGVTENHLMLTPHGYERAGALRVGDTLITATRFYLSPIHLDVAIGSALGDGSLRYHSDHNVSLRIGHGAKQDAYAKWKASLFAGVIGYEGRNSRGGISFDTIPMYELAEVYTNAYRNGKKHPSQNLIDHLSPLAVAIWYMDDGTLYGGQTRHGKPRTARASLSLAGFELEARVALQRWFIEQGIECNTSTHGNLIFTVDGTKRLHSMIARFVHPSMDYKLLPEYRGLFQSLDNSLCERLEPVPMQILDIYQKPKTRSMNRFDIEVEGNHCYLVDGVVVHNSPETTPGGRALKFYASVRIDIRRTESIKSGEDVVGNRTKVKIKKNKVAPPFKECEFDIMFMEHGISKTGEILDLAVNLNIVEKRGAFFRYNEGLLGQGRENARQFLQENTAVALEIEDLIRQHYGLPPLVSLPGG